MSARRVRNLLLAALAAAGACAAAQSGPLPPDPDLPADTPTVDPWASVERTLDPTNDLELERGAASDIAAESVSSDGRSAAPGTGAPDVDLTVPAESGAESVAGVKPLVRRRAADRAGPGTETGSAGATVSSYLRSAASLAAVVALIALLAWGYRTTLQRGGLVWSGRVRRPGLIEVVSRLTLGPRQTVCLVRVGPRMVLLGLGADRISTLDVISDPEVAAQLAGEAQRRASDGASAEFGTLLEREAREYTDTEQQAAALAAAVDTAVAADGKRLHDVRGDLVSTLRKLRVAAGMDR